MSELKLIVMNNMKEFGAIVNEHLKEIKKEENDFVIPLNQVRFSNGEGKVKLLDSVRGKDVFILTDVGNYHESYEAFGRVHYMGPDEHFQDLKRTIMAIKGNATRINVIMPLLYESRQHARNGRESLDCAVALQELERIGVSNIITFDAHDPNVENAIPLTSFDNFFLTNTMLSKFILDNKINFNKLLVISPDEGAMKRSRYYSGMLNCDIGMFYKRRDYSQIVNGKNPIIEHKYLGKEEEGLEYLIVDDMIASGGSVIDILKQLMPRKPKQTYIMATYAFFTNGLEVFNQAFKDNMFKKIYTTNLSYLPEELKKIEWLEIVDCTKYMAEVIHTYHNMDSISPLMNGRKEMFELIEKKKMEK